MSTVTPLLNLVKPASPEQFSLATYTNNLDIVDNWLSSKGLIVEKFQSTVAGSTNSNFTRIRNATQGIIVARVIIDMGATVLPANTASNQLLVSGAVPASCRPKWTLFQLPCIITGTARGDNCQATIAVGSGDVSARSAGTSFTALSGSSLALLTAYEWDGTV